MCKVHRTYHTRRLRTRTAYVQYTPPEAGPQRRQRRLSRQCNTRQRARAEKRLQAARLAMHTYGVSATPQLPSRPKGSATTPKSIHNLHHRLLIASPSATHQPPPNRVCILSFTSQQMTGGVAWSAKDGADRVSLRPRGIQMPFMRWVCRSDIEKLHSTLGHLFHACGAAGSDPTPFAGRCRPLPTETFGVV